MLITEARALKLTRKHFNLVAEIIGQVNCQENRHELMWQHASLFEKTHPAFDRARFEAKVHDVHVKCWEPVDWAGERRAEAFGGE